MSSSYDIKCKVIEEELRSVWPDWHVAGRLGGSTSSDVFQIYRDNFGIRVDSALKVIQVDSGTAAVTSSSRGQDDGETEAGEAEAEKTEAVGQSDIPEALLGEIQIMEALRGAPNIVAIEDYSFKREGSTCSLFVRMELLTSLQEILAGRGGHGPLSTILEISRLGRDICTALMHCEKKGIIHRDIKPENLFVDEFGHYKAGDFGTSKRMDTVHAARTMTGIGTISYMAPEIFQGRSYNNTADIYSLGLVLYQLLNNGRMPFLPTEDSYTAQDVDSANYQRLHGMPVPGLTGRTVGGEMIDSRLDAVVCKACAVDPEDRYQTAKEFYEALELRETAEKKNVPVYKKRPQGSLAPIESLQNQQQERLQAESGIKPFVDLEPAVSIQSLLEEKERLKSEEKMSASPLPDMSSKSLPPEREESEPGEKEKPSASPPPDMSSKSLPLEREESEPGEKENPSTAPLPDMSSKSLPPEREESEPGEKENPSTAPLPDSSSQILPHEIRLSWPEEMTSAAPSKEEKRSGRKNKPVIAIVLLLIIAAVALVALHNGRGISVSPDTEAPDSVSTDNNRAPRRLTDSWDEIIAAGKDGTYIYKYRIGDTKELDLGEEGLIEMELVAFDADELAFFNGKAHMTWIAKDLLKTKQPMKKKWTNRGGWPKSDMRAWLRKNVLPLLPKTVRSNIKKVKKYSYSKSDGKTISSSDKIWIPSRREIFGKNNAFEDKGPEYVTAFTDDASRIKRHPGNSNPSHWWLRSASYSGKDYFSGVSDSGSCWNGSGPSGYQGVAIGFCF